MRIIIEREPNRYYPDFKRVIIRFFDNGFERSKSLVQKIIDMDDQQVKLALYQTLRDFAKRHRNLSHKFLGHYNKVKDILENSSLNLKGLSEDKKLLIGSYFSMEYSIESAAFFNPSMVMSPDQTGLEEGSVRIIVSFRATGEGHISSIVFHTGIIDYKGDLYFEESGNYVDEPAAVRRHHYNKKTILNKLSEMNVDQKIISLVLEPLNDKFSYGELNHSIQNVLENGDLSERKKRSVEEISWLADSHYELTFSRDTHISERVIFPISYSERKGIEDARFVRFVDDDGEVTYYATYTAYDGYTILPKLILTKNFYHFEVKPLHGKGAHNKNLALFPRKINGKYAMLSRIDGVNSFISFSDNINVWSDPVKMQEPKHPWEFVQMGNCGAPEETPEGWLLITHGVGPMRRYCLGVSLLDLEDPAKEIGRLGEPLLIPNENEREGYVPNVVYSCGSMIHNDKIIIPYGLSDTGAGFLSVKLEDLMKRLVKSN